MISGATSGEGGAGLGIHLENGEENEAVHLLDARGLGGDTIQEQLRELTAGAVHGRSRRRIYHLHIDPPEGWDHREDVHQDLLRRIEAEFGLEGQQRASVRHVKEGAFRREHRHYVWSLVRDDGSVIRMSNDYYRRQRCAAESAHAFGMPCPPLAHARPVHAALVKMGLDDVAAYVAASGELEGGRRAAARTARDRLIENRTGIRLADVRAAAHEAWRASDNGAAFREALGERGLILAMGNSAPVVIDRAGTAHRLTSAVSAGAKAGGAAVAAAEVHARIAGIDLPFYKDAKGTRAGSHAQAKAEAVAAAEAPAQAAPVSARKQRAAARAASRAAARDAGRKGRDTKRARAERAAAETAAQTSAAPEVPAGAGALERLDGIDAAAFEGVDFGLGDDAEPAAGPPAVAEGPAPAETPADRDAYRGAETFEGAWLMAFGGQVRSDRPALPPRAARTAVKIAPARPVAPEPPQAPPRPAAVGADLHAASWEPRGWWAGVVEDVRGWLFRGAPEPVSPSVPPTPEPKAHTLAPDAPLDFVVERNDAHRQVAVRRFTRIFRHAGQPDPAGAADYLVRLREGAIVHNYTPAILGRGWTPADVARQRQDLAARAAELAETERRLRAAPPAVPRIDALWLAHCRRAHGPLTARTEGDIEKARARLSQARAAGDSREVRRWESALSILANERHRLLVRLRYDEWGHPSSAWRRLNSDAGEAPRYLDELRRRHLRAIVAERAAVAAAIKASDPVPGPAARPQAGGYVKGGYAKGGGARPVPMRSTEESAPFKPGG